MTRYTRIQVDLSSGRTMHLNILGRFAIPAYQGVDPTEAEMDELDSMLPDGIRYERGPRDEDVPLSTGAVARVNIHLGQASHPRGVNSRLTDAEELELRRIMRRRGITPRWWCSIEDED